MKALYGKLSSSIKYRCFSIFLILFLIQVSSLKAQIFFDLESGVVSSGYNDVQIPGNTGTRFSLKDDLTPEARVFYRIRAGFTLNDRHTFSLLYAPLTIDADGNINKTVNFAGKSFAANTPLEATYRFNSYRLTYRYDIVKRDAVEFGLGFTAKIRDAEIALKSEQQSGNKTNVGFVPIVNFRLSVLMNERFGILLEGDALASKQGRAEDVLLAATYKFSEAFKLKAGYRILEGGADNDEVYNFTLLNYGVLGLIITL